ncbi:hypothetical protein IEQ34_001846 [Dendrobium chrysotoxum]|uniref:Uncharacterized protein n=1 Tax=Dendrobium chrysotoxum TaxID=161865 RepID=A0AAV7H4C0_DENCH|nr:hypothetical protein IEQ34_001846 [Dendrobium chrysotoxum]
MSPSPLFLCQNNSNHTRNQNISQSNLDSEQDFAFKNNKEEELMASFPCSSSSSSNLLVKKEELGVVIEPPGGDDDDDQNGGYRTPSSLESRIPEMVHCPPAPKKPYKVCRRKVVKHCSNSQRIDFLEGLGLVVFEEVRCHRRRWRRRHRVRGRLPITNATEAGKR